MLIQKLKDKFPEERLMLNISAIQDEQKMRDSIEKCLELNPIKEKKICLETGTYLGLSAALLSDYFDEIHTVDIVKGKGGYYPEEKLKFEIWDYLGIQDKIKFHLINDNSEKNDLFKKIPYNFSFVDGKHKGDGGVIDDFELVKHCGRILFHDYMPEKAKGNNLHAYVVNFINSLGKDVVYKNEPFAVWINKNFK